MRDRGTPFSRVMQEELRETRGFFPSCLKPRLGLRLLLPPPVTPCHPLPPFPRFPFEEDRETCDSTRATTRESRSGEVHVSISRLRVAT